MADFVGQTVAERGTGGHPSRLRSIAAAVVIGAGAALLAYRLLRSEPRGEAGTAADA